MSPEDLFEFAQYGPAVDKFDAGPLAYRMRPKTLDEFMGQEAIFGQGKPLRAWIERDQVPSLILWGPPGSGKTTLAQIIAHHTRAHFQNLSAVLSGIKEIKEVIASAKSLRRMDRKKTILFVDEIHRFNKAQQDALLPHVEEGTVTFIGATTENPSFEINSALLSRTRVIHLSRLSEQAIGRIIERALIQSPQGLGGRYSFSAEAIRWLARTADGDARRALAALDAVILLAATLDPVPVFQVEHVKKALESTLERQPISYDQRGEEHYNIISAFIKSIRDSDPHAGLYYLARMLEGGEDPLFIVRRLVILASEDVGNADPQALLIAMATQQAVQFVGMPEARINLAQAVTYLATAPKSNASYLGINQAIEEVKQSGALPVPMHLRNSVTQLMRAEGYGKNYRYVHSDPTAKTQTHLPDALLGKRFYEPNS